MARVFDNAFVLMVLIIGGLVLLVLLAAGSCWGLFFLFSGTGTMISSAGEEEKLAAQHTALSFFEDVRNNELEPALRKTSKSFQGRYPLPEFQKLLETYPGLRKYPEESFVLRPAGRTQFKYESQIRGDDGTRYRVYVDLVKEGEDWKVDSLSVR